jgi:hypothetical protein
MGTGMLHLFPEVNEMLSKVSVLFKLQGLLEQRNHLTLLLLTCALDMPPPHHLPKVSLIAVYIPCIINTYVNF